MSISTPPDQSNSLASAAQSLAALRLPDPADTGTGPFPSLMALRKAHLRMLLRAKDPAETPSPGDIDAFLDRATATGARLDAPEDREAAQFILDYWTAAQYTARVPYASLESKAQRPQAPIAVRRLAAFDSDSIGHAAEAAENAIKTLSAAEMETARRILLRLVRLAGDGETFLPEPARASDLELGDPARVEKVIGILETAGVVVQSPDAAEKTYALQFESITRAWKRYAEWLDRRKRFRAQVRIWEKSARNPATLLDGELLDEAHAYHDLTELEREFLRGSRERERHRRRLGHIWLAIVIVLCILASIGWIRASRKASIAEERQQELNEKNVQLAHRNAERSKRLMLANMVGAVQALARIGASETPEYRQRNYKRWADLDRDADLLHQEYVTAVAQLREAAGDDATRSDDALLAELRKFSDQFGRTKLDARDTEGLKSASLRSQQLGQALKNALIRANDAAGIEFLESLRINTYQAVEQCVRQIRDRVDGNDFQSAVPFIREFWVLSYGEVGIVGGNRVLAAMEGYGTALRKLRSDVDRELPDSVKAIIRKQDNRGSGPLEFWQNADVAMRQDKSGSVKDSFRKAGSKEDQFTELKRAGDELVRALDAELKHEIRPEDVSLKAY
jgi:hypothetical protein